MLRKIIRKIVREEIKEIKDNAFKETLDHQETVRELVDIRLNSFDEKISDLVEESNKQLNEIGSTLKRKHIDTIEEYKHDHREVKILNERHHRLIEGWLKIFMERTGIDLEGNK